MLPTWNDSNCPFIRNIFYITGKARFELKETNISQELVTYTILTELVLRQDKGIERGHQRNIS